MSYGYAHPHYAAYPAAPLRQPVRRSAPPSVHTLAILHYLGAALQLAAAAVLLTMPADPFAGDSQFADPARLTPIAYTVAGVLAASALISVFIGRKLQRGRQWARVLMIMLNLVAVGSVVVAVATTNDPAQAAGLVGPALYLLLLNTRAARSWFRWHTW
ncbi:hypothetical protein [Catenuloplanes atrovinosus]|uniref:Neutral ceramidase superfamily lipid hydrolase n=1 Tax=Catenuloplanes atrovinosus TaxID=137266 RepID=A0AAE3YKB5_9ACTN|nr:hypothetical protein [Catenuloplanes atrovinosus]MDR7274492.1 putative neutral ceramidase superfamily lipid hydrolase [Catenuloplanes atrovinosus]